MIIITDKPNHPAIFSHKNPGYLLTLDDQIIYFDDLAFFEENAEWPDQDPPFYYYWNKKENFRSGISVSNVKAIYFQNERIRGLEEN